MKKFSSFDLKFYFEQNRGYYIVFLCFLILGVILGLVVSFTSDGYINLLSSKDNNLIEMINGGGSSFWNRLFLFLIPIMLIFLLSFNYYLGMLGYVVVLYQTMLLILSISAVIKVYGITGVFSSIFLTIPINLIYLCDLGVMISTCQKRAKNAKRFHHFTYDFKTLDFWIKIVFCVLIVLILSLIVAFIYPLFVRNANFIVY